MFQTKWNQFVHHLFQKSTPKGNSVSFSCQHGPDECSGNKIHSCGLQVAHTQAQQVEFVTCQMSYGSEGSDLVRKKHI